MAVKVAKKEGLSKVELESFLREVSLLARLHHRNIVQVGAAVQLWTGYILLLTVFD